MWCLHSLQPTNPYTTPSIPCLKPSGFLRWQTIQLLLDPGEHAPFLQRAVSLYEVPKPDGSVFPKLIPPEVFPSKPDKETENWWKIVTNSMGQNNHTRRLESSPYHTPHENGNRNEYFDPTGRLSASAAHRPPRPSRHSSEDRTAEARRRSSVPELIFSQNGETRPESKGKSSRSRSAQRIPSGLSYLPPPQLAGPQRHPTSNYRHATTSSPYRPSTNGSTELNSHRRHRSSGGTSTPHRRNRSPSVIHESTGSEGSSEDSRSGHDRHKQDNRRRSSLFPPRFLHHHHRRHSHDATYDVSERAPPLPPRPPPIQTHVPHPHISHPQSPSSAATNRRRGASNVQFRNDIFVAEQASSSAPETPIAPDLPPPQMPVPRVRHEPPPHNMHLLQGAPLSRATSSEINREKPRNDFGPPVRSKTVTMGVGGRRYPNGTSHGEERYGGSAGRRKDRTMSATPTGSSQSG